MKKAQQEIIVTVLLVLIALAAVAAVAVFITNNVRQGTAQASAKAQCIQLNFEITRAVSSTSTVTIRRGTGGENIGLKELRLYVAGKQDTGATVNATDIPNTLETYDITATSLAKGDKVQLAPVLSDGSLCEPVGEATAV